MNMIEASDIPQEWRILLHLLQKVDSKAIIGGGCLRDLDRRDQVQRLSRYLAPQAIITPKDIDIFVSTSLGEFDPIVRAQYGDFIHETVSGEESAKADSSIESQLLWELPGLPKINILKCHSDIIPVERFARFDFGLCQIIYDGHRILLTDAYLKDKADKTFTLLRYTNSFAHENSLERYERFVARPEYSGYTLIIPQGLIPKLEDPLEEVDHKKP